MKRITQLVVALALVAALAIPASASAFWAGGFYVTASRYQVTYHVLVCGTPGRIVTLVGNYRELDEWGDPTGTIWRSAPFYAVEHRYCEWLRATDWTPMWEGDWVAFAAVSQGRQVYAINQPAYFTVY
jgi:hypothetical protein